jgi:hypothetical protein
MVKRPVLLCVLVASCLVLFSYTVYRACNLSFTHDESLSYSIVAYSSLWYFNVNNHPLNTRLMRWCLHWLGDREWALRLPNVMAHAIYLSFGTLLLWELEEASFVVLGFALLNLNPFLLDFFSLARGYGLALGLSMGALYFFKRAWSEVALNRIVLRLTVGLTFAALAALANFTWINCYLALVAGAFLLLFLKRRTFQPERYTLMVSALLFAANAWFTWNLVRRVLVLLRKGVLEGGGPNGFFVDTVYSLIRSALYGWKPLDTSIWPLMILIVGIQLVLGMAAMRRNLRDRQFEFSSLLILVQLLVSAAIVAQHILLRSDYPLDRGALYFMPITALIIAFTGNDIFVAGGSQLRAFLKVASAAVYVAVIFHFSSTANLTHTYIWTYDADTKTALIEMDRLFAGRGKNLKVGNYWALEPTMNYYRLTRHYDWMSVVTRDPVSAPDNYAVYCFPTDVAALPAGFTLVRAFPVSRGQLWIRILPPQQRSKL